VRGSPRWELRQAYSSLATTARSSALAFKKTHVMGDSPRNQRLTVRLETPKALANASDLHKGPSRHGSERLKRSNRRITRRTSTRRASRVEALWTCKLRAFQSGILAILGRRLSARQSVQGLRAALTKLPDSGEEITDGLSLLWT
jgi:hypothetical protein